ncbi:hypothetical protein CANINC_002346 [Pichia inconspicua]|uniref:Uncharacterized protein n=1 Tax=Pichia inconspicua TaxID=52247 RepID=A0A4T0X1G0_9ASCO|nr:hypothetical protein CANINC_002346 [[Candida] inconspicua]
MKGDKGKLGSDKDLIKLTEPYIAKFDQKLEDILLEFEDYDYTYQALLTQAEFEEEFMPIIGKLFRRSNKYDIIYEIFDTLISRSMRDLHKLLCLIDLMINISRHDPTVFKKLPNAIMSKIAEHPVFPKIEQYVYNMGRMNYRFKRFNLVRDESVQHDQSSASSSDSEDESNSRYKHAHVSLAELTCKIMSQTAAKQKNVKANTTVTIKEEDDDSLLDEQPEDDEEESYYSNRRLQKVKAKSELEGLMESDSEYESEHQSDEDNQEQLEYHSDVDPTMSTVTSILEHNMDYKLMDDSTPNLNKRQIDFHHFNELDGLKQISKRKKTELSHKTKSTKVKKPKRKSPVRRKTYYVLENDLDFVFDQVFTRAPICNSRLLKAEIKGFVYKPAQFELFSTLTEEECGMSSDIARRADEMLNTFVLQQAKRAGGCEIDRTQYVHPFEYDYIIENFEKLKEQGVKLPPIIMYDRYGSMYDIEDNINKDFNIRSIKNTKVKGLIKLVPFKSEDEYFDVFKKIVPRDQVASRILFLEKLVTDGKSLFVFDLMDNIVKAMEEIPRLMEDSEAEEEAMKQQEIQIEKDIIEAQANIEESLRVEQGLSAPPTDVEIDSVETPTISELISDKDPTSDVGRQTLIEKMSRNISEFVSGTQKVANNEYFSGDGLNGNENNNENDQVLQEKPGESETLTDISNTESSPRNNSQNNFESNVDEIEKKHIEEVVTNNHSEEVKTKEDPVGKSLTEQKLYKGEDQFTKTTETQEILVERNFITGKSLEEEDGIESSLTMPTLAKDILKQSDPLNDKQPNNVDSPDEQISGTSPNKDLLTHDDKNVEEAVLQNITSNPNEKEETETDNTDVNKVSEDVDTKDKNELAGSSDKQSLLKMMKVQRPKTKLRIDAIKSDLRETKFVSAKGISVPTKSIKKVLSTQERFNLLALLLFPGLKFKGTQEALPTQYIKTIGYAFDGFRPYLLSLILDDQLEFLKLPKYFKVDSTMFELQVQYLKEHPGSKRAFIKS